VCGGAKHRMKMRPGLISETSKRCSGL